MGDRSDSKIKLIRENLDKGYLRVVPLQADTGKGSSMQGMTYRQQQVTLPRSASFIALDSDRRYWFDEADTQEIMENNIQYQQRTPAEALFMDSSLSRET